MLNQSAPPYFLPRHGPQPISRILYNTSVVASQQQACQCSPSYEAASSVAHSPSVCPSFLLSSAFHLFSLAPARLKLLSGQALTSDLTASCSIIDSSHHQCHCHNIDTCRACIRSSVISCIICCIMQPKSSYLKQEAKLLLKQPTVLPHSTLIRGSRDAIAHVTI